MPLILDEAGDADAPSCATVWQTARGSGSSPSGGYGQPSAGASRSPMSAAISPRPARRLEIEILGERRAAVVGTGAALRSGECKAADVRQQRYCSSLRHSRESGNPGPQVPSLALDSRFRGNDGKIELRDSDDDQTPQHSHRHGRSDGAGVSADPWPPLVKAPNIQALADRGMVFDTPIARARSARPRASP